ncbi:MAG: SAM-dependent methyltransferase [Alphaproteobacteria bacterium PA2]|nr:MAG: SAM-dependent methyltransferase [Alphaproteobacteria bacterium PA2]
MPDLNSTTDLTEINRTAWNASPYEAWVRMYGEPSVVARQIAGDPGRMMRRFRDHLGDLKGKRICNLQGSHGRLAVALALEGADVTVIDFASENQRYALDLARHAGVGLQYIVSDVMRVVGLDLGGQFDLVLTELGILHYHTDLIRFFGVTRFLLSETGVVVLNEFHPMERKVFSQPNGDGDYFKSDLVLGDVPYASGNDLVAQCAYRFWTLGEIVTAAIEAGLTIKRLEEHPDWNVPLRPGTFTLVAAR